MQVHSSPEGSFGDHEADLQKTFASVAACGIQQFGNSVVRYGCVETSARLRPCRLFSKQSWQLERKQTSGSRYLSTLSQRMLPACSYVQHASYSPHCMSSTLFYKVAFVDSLRLLKSTRASHEAIQRWHEMERMSRHCILVKKGAPFPVDHSLKSLRK